MYKRPVGRNGLEMCPCCGYAILELGADFEICDICFWEDDGQDFEDIDLEVEGCAGPNEVSLQQARKNFLKFGAAEKKDIQHVRAVSSRDEKLKDFSNEQ